jgi:quinol monooxygenase YgiN
MIHVIATIELHPNSRDAFLTKFRDLVPLVLAEDGCISYVPALDIPSGLAAQADFTADTVLVIEQWRDLPALKVHLAAPHMNQFRESVQGLVRSIRLQVLQEALTA